jgi:hypothetical protein
MDTTIEPNETLTADKLVAAYVKIRDAKRELERETETKVAELDAQLDTIESKLLSICDEQGVEGLKTQAGTASRRIKAKYWTNDWESFYDFIAEHDAFALLEKRVHQTNMKTFLEENPGTSPVGLNVDREYTIVVTRSKTKI